MKQTNLFVAITVFAMAISVTSCSKIDCFPWKDHGKKFQFPPGDCDVERLYWTDEVGAAHVEMEKTYNSEGLINTIGFYTYSAGFETYWHRFSLIYNSAERSVVIVDSASGLPVLKAMFNHSAKLTHLKRLQGETSDFADRTFHYAGGRLVKIFSRWKTFDDDENFTYDASGNIVSREKADLTGVNEASVYTFGASATGNRQFYLPQFNYQILSDPSMMLLEYLRWVDEFSHKNILTHIEYTAPLPSAESYIDHVFDSQGNLTSYSNGNFPGGTKYLVWRCGRKKK